MKRVGIIFVVVAAAVGTLGAAAASAGNSGPSPGPFHHCVNCRK